jgi:hypothetical protein
VVAGGDWRDSGHLRSRKHFADQSGARELLKRSEVR